MITWSAGWGDQGEVDVFGGDLRRTGGSQQGVGEFMAAVGVGEPPRGGIDEGEALHRGQSLLTFAEDRHGGQALPAGDGAGAGGNRRSGSSSSPRADAASSRVRDKSNSSRLGRVTRLRTREMADHSSSTRAIDRARQGASRSTTLGDSSPWRTSVPPSSSTTSS